MEHLFFLQIHSKPYFQEVILISNKYFYKISHIKLDILKINLEKPVYIKLKTPQTNTVVLRVKNN